MMYLRSVVHVASLMNEMSFDENITRTRHMTHWYLSCKYQILMKRTVKNCITNTLLQIFGNLYKV